MISQYVLVCNVSICLSNAAINYTSPVNVNILMYITVLIISFKMVLYFTYYIFSKLGPTAFRKRGECDIIGLL